MTFEYNRIRPDFVDTVELLDIDSEEWVEYKRSIYDESKEIPDSRQEIISRGDVSRFERLFKELQFGAGVEKIVQALEFDEPLWHYIENRQEVISDVKRNGWRSDIDVEINEDAPVKYRGLCRHSKDDTYRDGDDALCCWECSNKPGNRPVKFEASDDPVEQCVLSTVNGHHVREKVHDNLTLDTGQKWGQHLQNAGYDGKSTASLVRRVRNERSQALKLAYEIALPNFEYHYNRAEALLRDIDSDVAEDSNTGEGGRRFEENVRREFAEYDIEASSERVFRITFDDEAPEFAWEDFVKSPSEPTYKEADAIIHLDGDPIICEIFTQRQRDQKKKQVLNYAELYELATGTKPDTWMITNGTTDVLSLDSLGKLAGLGQGAE